MVGCGDTRDGKHQRRAATLVVGSQKSLFERAQIGDNHPSFVVGINHPTRRMAASIEGDFVEQLAIGIRLHGLAGQVRGLRVLRFVVIAIAFAFGSVTILTAITVEILSAFDGLRRHGEREFHAGVFSGCFPLLFDLAIHHHDRYGGRGCGRWRGWRDNKVLGSLFARHRNHLAVIQMFHVGRWVWCCAGEGGSAWRWSGNSRR